MSRPMSPLLKKALQPTKARLAELAETEGLPEKVAALLRAFGENFYRSGSDVTGIRREAGATEWDLKVFKRELGITAHDLLCELRLEVILWLLRESSLSVTKIGELTGTSKRTVERLCEKKLGLSSKPASARLRQVEPAERAGADLLLSWYLFVRTYRGELALVDLRGPLAFVRGLAGSSA